MHRIQITIELEDEEYRAYEFEAERAETSVEQLVEHMVQGLYQDLKQEEKEGDHEILFP